MGLELLLKVFLLQIFLASIVIFALRKVLNNMLIDLAIRHFGLWMQRQQAHGQPAEKIVIISHKPLKPKYREKILKIMARYSGQIIQPAFEMDKSILGGLVIKGTGDAFDFSLKSRLNEAFSQRG